MPIYDYRCTACGTQVEVMHAIDAAGPTACDVCGGVMRKALSPPAIHFRGSGWAKKDARSTASTDKRRDAAKDAGTDESKGDTAGKDAASSGTKADDGAPTKPAASSSASSAGSAD